MAQHDIHAHRVLILDFGSQYTQLIARRVREIGVYCEIHPFDMDDAAIRAFAPRGIILAGGPESVHQADSPRAPTSASADAGRAPSSGAGSPSGSAEGVTHAL